MKQTGPNNSLTDVPGLNVGHYTDRPAASGVTVVLCPQGAVAGVEVRGSAPGTRETALLRPQNLVDQVQAVVFSGGSVFGLAAADGVVRWLSERRIGFPLADGLAVPIVPGAVLFDLGRGKAAIPPVDAGWGLAACEAAGEVLFETGSVGAGTGACAGGIKGGVGTASLELESGILVAALAVVNSWGSVIDPESGMFWEIDRNHPGEIPSQALRRVTLPPLKRRDPLQSTTLGLVATDLELSAAQALKIAQMAHNGIARSIRPSHTMLDGDTVFCLSTGTKKLTKDKGESAFLISTLGEAAAGCLSRAVIQGILNATSLAGMTAFRDLPSRS